MSRYRRLADRVGHRGTSLLALGTFDLVYGWTRLIHPDPVAAQSQQMRLIGELFPPLGPEATLNAWGYLWWAAGVVCIANAFRREGDDWWGYAAAIGIKVGWLGANVWAWSQGLAGGGGTVAVWALFLFFAVSQAMRGEPSKQVQRIIGEGDTGENAKRWKTRKEDDDRGR